MHSGSFTVPVHVYRCTFYLQPYIPIYMTFYLQSSHFFLCVRRFTDYLYLYWMFHSNYQLIICWSVSDLRQTHCLFQPQLPFSQAWSSVRDGIFLVRSMTSCQLVYVPFKTRFSIWGRGVFHDWMVFCLKG